MLLMDIIRDLLSRFNLLVLLFSFFSSYDTFLPCLPISTKIRDQDI